MILPKDFSIQDDGLPYGKRDKSISGHPVPPIVTFMSPELPQNVHVVVLQRLVQLPTGDRHKDERDKWSLTGG